MENTYSAIMAILTKALKNSTLSAISFFLFCMALTHASEEQQKPPSVTLDLLNKVSAKKHRIKIPLGSAYLIQDLRIVPRSCVKTKNVLYKQEEYIAHIDIFLEQDVKPEDAAPILLFTHSLNSNPLNPSPPLEHSMYDIALISCEE